jgi:serine/threonine protein kinase
MNLPQNENQETPPTSIDRPKEPWADKWVLDDSLPSKGGNQSLVRAVREIDANRQGALKTTKHSSNSERRARMVREAQILKLLAGIFGVPQLLDHNVSAPEDEAFFIVLEWIDGAPLSEHFRGTVPIDECAEIALKLCTIVQQCHERGVIHRDIKPDNIQPESQ